MTQSNLIPANPPDPGPKPLPETAAELVAALIARLTLPVQQIKAIKGIMAGGTPDAVARAAGVHRATLYRWMKDDAQFARALAECRAAVRFSVQENMLAMADECIDTVADAIHKGDAHVALKLLKLMGIFNFTSDIEQSAVARATNVRQE